MTRYLTTRILSAVPVIIGVSAIVFIIMHVLPGDPAAFILSGTPASKAQVQELSKSLGLDKPLVTQYVDFAGGALHGDFGRSYQSRDCVTTIIAGQLPATLELAVAAVVVGSLVGTLIGCIAAVRRNGPVDNASMLVAVGGISMPSFWFGIILIFIFSLRLGWFPATGSNGLRGLVLPAVTLGLAFSAGVARLVRSAMLEVLQQDYVRTATAKGLRGITVVGRHALRNALIPVVTFIGIQFGNALGGAVVVETVFSRQGVGRLTVQALTQKDIPVVQGVILTLALLQVAINLTVDLSYGLLDPRIRYG